MICQMHAFGLALTVGILLENYRTERLVELKPRFGKILRSDFEGRREDKRGRIAYPQT